MTTEAEPLVRVNYGWIARIAERVGFPAAVLIVIGLALGITANWAAIHVVEPVVSGHLEFLRVATETMKSNTEINRNMAKTLEQIEVRLSQVDDVLDELVRERRR